MTTGQIAKVLGKKLPNISKHIKILHQEGLIFPHGYGKWAILSKEEKQGKNGKSSKSQMKQMNLEETEEVRSKTQM
jgi:Mn-dependent DtxR family transcriptional regulator